jgi:myo-inositol-1(or 4)-monophosphatase
LPASDAGMERAALGRFLAEVLREAGALALSTFGGPLKSWTKDNKSPVSEADMAVDAFLRERLCTADPGCAWFSEENHEVTTRATARRVWIVDPIDGTRAYLAGRTDWSIAVALAEAGRPIVGAIFAPVEDSMFLAVAGLGATLNEKPIKISTEPDLAGARMAGPTPCLELMARLIPSVTPVPRIHSLALRLARVAQGELDVAFASASSHDWDLAAADLVVEEAGGLLSSLGGEPLIYNQTDPVHGALVAASRARHACIIELVRGQCGGFEVPSIRAARS